MMSEPSNAARRLQAVRAKQNKLRTQLAQLEQEEKALISTSNDSRKTNPPPPLCKGQGNQRPKLLPQDYHIGRGSDTASPSSTDTVAERLWAAFRKAPNPKPPAKELKEALAMLRQINTHIKYGVHTVIDVCGGHGILALLLLIYRKCSRAMVLDIAQPPSHQALRNLWQEFIPEDAELIYRVCDMTEVLSDELARAQAIAPSGYRVVAVALHACDFLTDIVIDTCIQAGADFAVMPCCAKERHNGQLKAAARSQNISTEAAIDMVRLAEVQRKGYACRWKTIDASITQHNRILIGSPRKAGDKNMGHTDADISVLKKRWCNLHGT